MVAARFCSDKAVGDMTPGSVRISAHAGNGRAGHDCLVVGSGVLVS